MNTKHKHCSPEELYKRILEIGSECISCGTNLKEIKKQLCDSNLIDPNDDDNTVKLLFLESFYDNTHYNSNSCKHPFPNIDLSDAEFERLKKLHEEHNHEEMCTWFLQSDSLMNLFKLKESQRNSKIAKTASRISYAAILLSFLILISNLLTRPKLSQIYETEEYKSLYNKVDSIRLHNEFIHKQIILLDSIEITIQEMDSISHRKLEETNKTLNLINCRVNTIKEIMKSEK